MTDDNDTLKCCYNSIIFRLCKDRLVNQACDLYSDMIHVNNIEPNYTTYQNLTYGYCILGQFKQAMELFRYRISHHTLVTEQEVKSAKCAAALMIKGGVKPNAASYHSVIGRL
jgi:pentatricopeptide repeat domain-containing protein 1